MIKPGARLLLDFRLKVVQGNVVKEISFSELLTRPTIVSVYMRNNTGGCDKQIDSLAKQAAEFARKGYNLVAVITGADALMRGSFQRQAKPMIEGWHNDDYLVLFENQEEAARMTEQYGVRQYLPGYTVVGLRGWDDFILTDSKQQFFTIPTVPLEPKHLEPFSFNVDLTALMPDERFTKKVKWYVKPILFGGDATAKENMAWVSLEQHAELVRWWSKLYRDTVAKNKTA